MLSGQTAIITGGAQGLGFAIAERFVAEGARVVIGDLDPDATAAATERLGGDDVAVAPSGVTSPGRLTSTASCRRPSSGSVAWTSW